MLHIAEQQEAKKWQQRNNTGYNLQPQRWYLGLGIQSKDLECMSINQKEGGRAFWNVSTVRLCYTKLREVVQRSPGLPSSREAVEIFTLFQHKGKRRWRKIVRRTETSAVVPSVVEYWGFSILQLQSSGMKAAFKQWKCWDEMDWRLK